MQISGAANAPQSQSQSQSPDGLLGFLNTLIQQINATSPGGATSPTAQISPQDLKALMEKIAGLLKKDGVSAADLQSMSPQDLAAKITAVMQQQNITLPSALQSLTSQDLASLIQQNGALTGNSPGIKPSLTSDLIAPQSTNIQDTNVQTKDDIAKKISGELEQQQQQGAATPLNPAQLHQLKDDLAQLQSAPGVVSPDTMKQLTTDIGSFLTSQGVDQASITSFLADLTQAVQKGQTPPAADTSAANTDTTPTTPVVTASVVPPVVQQTQTDASQPPSAQGNTSAPSSQVADTSANTPVKNFWQHDNKNQVFGGNAAATARETTGADAPSQLSALIAQQQQSQTPAPQDLTAKIAGFSVNPALINDLANNSGGGSGFGNGFGSQGDNAQQSPDLTGTAALLQPLNADMLQNQNFTNYLNTSSGQASPTTQMVNVQLQSNISAGVNSMTLQLEPADLGKLNVKLSFTKDGAVKAHMTVDKPETLALLQKDSSHLQRALQQSGLTTDENSLSFDLRQQGQQHMGGFDGSGHAHDFDTHTDSSAADNILQAQIAVQSMGYITPSGVNIMV